MIQAAPLPMPTATGKMCGGSGGGDPPPDPALIAAAIKAALARSTVDIPDDDVTEVTTPGAAGTTSAGHAALHSAGHAGLAFPCADHACRGQDHQPWGGPDFPGHFPVEDWTDTRRTFFFF